MIVYPDLDMVKNNEGLRKHLMKSLTYHIFGKDRGPWFLPDRSTQHATQLLDGLVDSGMVVRVEKVTLHVSHTLPIKCYRVSIYSAAGDRCGTCVATDRKLATVYAAMRFYRLVTDEDQDEKRIWESFKTAGDN